MGNNSKNLTPIRKLIQMDSKLRNKSHDDCFSTSSMCPKMLGSSIVGVIWKENTSQMNALP